jgi:thioredoxin 1
MKRITVVTSICVVLCGSVCPAQQKPHSATIAASVIAKTVSCSDFESLLKKQGSGATLVDVRTHSEFEGGHLKSARNVDFRDPSFATLMGALDKNKPVFIYCMSGGRSGKALLALKDMGFREVYNLDGGILKWRSDGMPVEENEELAAHAKGMSMIDFKNHIAGPDYVLVDFNATWCGPCKKLMPILESLAAKRKGKMTLLKIDADQNPDLVRAKDISSIPYLELYKDGKLVWQHTGYIDEKALLAETKL